MGMDSNLNNILTIACRDWRNQENPYLEFLVSWSVSAMPTSLLFLTVICKSSK
jgi:hypothetical protein